MAVADDVSRIALALPQVVQGDASFEVHKKGFAWYYREKVEGQRVRVVRMDALAVRVSGEDEKQALLAADPAKFFTTDHYNGYPAILIRLPAIEIDELSELLTDGWRNRAPRRLVVEFDKKTAADKASSAP